MTDDDSGPGPLYQAMCEHARRRPDLPAIDDGTRRLTYAELRAVVDDRAAELRGQGREWLVLGRGPKAAFVIDYLAATAVGAPLIVDEGTAVTGQVRAVLQEHRAVVASIGLGAPEVMFTSGSSGEAKAVVLDGHRMYDKARHINAFLDVDRSYTEVLALPLYHSFGLGRLRCAIAAGRSVRLVERVGAPDEVLSIAAGYPAAGLALVASQVKVLVARYGAALRTVAPRLAGLEIGSEPLSVDDRLAVAEALPDTRVCMHYGMTELSRAAMIDLHDPGPEPAGAGHPLPDVQARFVPASDDAAALQELQLRGAAMVRAYVDGDSVRPVPSDTWLRTGDHGHRGADGSLVIDGRLSNVFKILGKNVVLEETEQALRHLIPGADCVCAGVDLIPGVAVLVAVVAAPPGDRLDRSELHRKLSRLLPGHQVPRRIIVTDRLPRLANGKPDRLAATRMAAAGRSARS